MLLVVLVILGSSRPRHVLEDGMLPLDSTPKDHHEDGDQRATSETKGTGTVRRDDKSGNGSTVLLKCIHKQHAVDRNKAQGPLLSDSPRRRLNSSDELGAQLNLARNRKENYRTG